MKEITKVTLFGFKMECFALRDGSVSLSRCVGMGINVAISVPNEARLSPDWRSLLISESLNQDPLSLLRLLNFVSPSDGHFGELSNYMWGSQSDQNKSVALSTSFPDEPKGEI